MLQIYHSIMIETVFQFQENSITNISQYNDN